MYSLDLIVCFSNGLPAGIKSTCTSQKPAMLFGTHKYTSTL